MQRHTSYMHLMTIKKARLGRQSIMARKVNHSYYTSGTAGSQIKEEENESYKHQNKHKGYERP